MPKKLSKELTVNIIFEPSRLKDLYLADVYEKSINYKNITESNSDYVNSYDFKEEEEQQ